MKDFTLRKRFLDCKSGTSSLFKGFVMLVVLMLMTTSSAMAQEPKFEVIDGFRYLLDSGTKTATLVPKTDGMGLYNLSFLRDFDFDNKVHNFVKEHYDWILLHDQDILNAVLHGNFKEVSIVWNVMNNAIIRKCDISPHQKEELLQNLQSIMIIHYTGPIKPWHKECYHPLKKEYWHYLNLSPLKDRHLVCRYESVKDKLLFLKCNWRAYLGLSLLSFIKIK